jgi:hypothetical protein
MNKVEQVPKVKNPEFIKEFTDAYADALEAIVTDPKMNFLKKSLIWWMNSENRKQYH